jgi:Mrp family chromosome partitioning ATPase
VDEAAEKRGNGARVGQGALHVLASGPIPPDPGEFVGTHQLEAALAHLREQSDVVLIDAPPLLHVGDALTLSAKVEALILVTRLGVVRRGMLDEVRRLLHAAPAEKLGFVVTAAEAEKHYGYGYGGGYYGRASRRKEADVAASETPV